MGMSESEHDTFEPLEPVRPPADDESTWLLGQALRLMHSTGESAEREYTHVIRLLRADAQRATTVAARLIEAAADEPMLRWSILHMLTDIEDATCLDVLHRQASRQLPERIRQEGGCEQLADYEELVAIMAVEGLGRLAAAGNHEAIEALREVVARQDRKSVRRPAAAALVAAQPDLRARVEQMLPEGERYLLGLREGTEDDLTVPVTDEDLTHKPPERRRETRPKPSPESRVGSAPRTMAGEGR